MHIAEPKRLGVEQHGGDNAECPHHTAADDKSGCDRKDRADCGVHFSGSAQVIRNDPTDRTKQYRRTNKGHFLDHLAARIWIVSKDVALALGIVAPVFK